MEVFSTFVSGLFDVGSTTSMPGTGKPTPPQTQEVHLQPLLGVAPLGHVPLIRDRLNQLNMLEAAFHHLPQRQDSERMKYVIYQFSVFWCAFDQEITIMICQASQRGLMKLLLDPWKIIATFDGEKKEKWNLEGELTFHHLFALNISTLNDLCNRILWFWFKSILVAVWPKFPPISWNCLLHISSQVLALESSIFFIAKNLLRKVFFLILMNFSFMLIVNSP